MEPIELLKIIKRKLFEPHKKIIYNTEGKKFFVDSLPSDPPQQTDSDEFMEMYNGWNVADKDYVNYKINELSKEIRLFKDKYVQIDTSSGNVSSKISPSAPPAPTFEKSTEAQKFKTMVYMKGVKDIKTKKYVFDTLLLKEGSIINEKHIYVQKQITIKDPVVLNSLKRGEDNKKMQDVKNSFIQNNSLKKGDKTNILSCMDEEYIKESCTAGFEIDFKTEDELGDISMQLYITTY